MNPDYEKRLTSREVQFDENGKLTKSELLRNLQRAVNFEFGDEEINHWIADTLLIKYINDPEVENLWDKIDRWYA